MNPADYLSDRAGRAIHTLKGYWAFIPDGLPPTLEMGEQLQLALSTADWDLAQLSALVARYPFPRLLRQPFVRQEAVLSSRIEGTRASLSDVLRFESAQLSFLENADDVREVHNYVRAVDFALERLATLPISLRLIREIHAHLMEGVRGGYLTPGEFRRSQNWIGSAGSTIDSATYVPPPVDDMHRGLANLEAFIHAPSKMPSLLRLGVIHYQFEAIHPFLDGNGRVGRLLLVVLLQQWGLLSVPLLNLSAYFERFRQEYYDRLLAVSQQGAWEDWLRFFLRGVSQQSQDSLHRLSKLEALRSRYDVVVRADKHATRMASFVDHLFSRPIFSVVQLTKEVDVPYVAVNRYVAKLVDAGILKEATGYKRNRIFVAHEVLKALEQTR